MANGNGQQIQSFRSWLADFRLRMNQEVDGMQSKLDEMEQQALKRQPLQASTLEIFDLDLKGKPERS